MMPTWLKLRRGNAPLLLSVPHAGTDLVHVREQTKSVWLATLDADWWVDRLYDFAAELDATVVVTSISRTVVDVNRDPSSKSLYPGMATTDLVPVTTFDGEPLYRDDRMPSSDEKASRQATYYDPYHATLKAELSRLRGLHPNVVLYDAHSIRSRVPRLFEGELPLFNIGTYEGRSCAQLLTERVADTCRRFSESLVVNGRFKGGAITRTYGDPDEGVHAIQMELACRAYVDEPATLDATSWPPPYVPERTAGIRDTLRDVLKRCIDFAKR